MKTIDFSKNPENIISYNFGDAVTRDNFINFLLLSYAVSKGNFVIQRVFFLLMEEKIGFPYKDTIQNFFKNGSYEALSKEERNLFFKSFRNVKKHLQIYEEIEIEDEIKDEIDGLYDRPKSVGEIPLNAALAFFDFAQIKSISDFMKKAKEFNERFEDSLN